MNAVSRIVEVRMPPFPECWETCGNCQTEAVFVQSVMVRAGESVSYDDTLIVLETGKVALDIPSPQKGTIVEVRVDEGDLIDEGAVIVIVLVEVA